MSRLQKMIEELCPTGVEYKKLGEVCEIKGRIGFRGYTRQDLVEESQGAISLSPSNIINGELRFDKCTYVSWAKYEESPEIMVNEGDIVFTKTASVGKTALIKWLPKQATINPQLVLLKNITCNNAYLSYILKGDKFQNDVRKITGVGSVPNVPQSALASIEIPVPPLPVQEEIVRILDKFTTLEAELEAELDCRKRQYEFYRNQLLSFEGERSEGVKWVTLGDLSKVVTKQTGFDYTKTIKPSLLRSPNRDSLPYLQTKNFSGRSFDYNTDYYVPRHIADQFPRIVLNKQCLLFSIVGASIGNVGLFPGIKECFLGGAICVLKFKEGINAHYVYEIMSSWYGQSIIKKKTKGLGQATVTVEDIRNFIIPVPPLTEQRRIVSILDRFEALTTDLQSGLPAEIEARRKQYEYYREQLLTFKRKTA